MIPRFQVSRVPPWQIYSFQGQVPGFHGYRVPGFQFQELTVPNLQGSRFARVHASFTNNDMSRAMQKAIVAHCKIVATVVNK